MEATNSFPTDAFGQEDSFRFIKPDEFETYGIDPADIPLGTFAALKHPAQLQSRFGGNAYGFGLFESFDRLRPADIKLLQSVTFNNPEDIKNHYKKLNSIYKKIGLLVRFSRIGRPYYLIPVHLVTNTLTHIKAKVDEISKIVGFHRKKYLKEYHDIGLVTHQDDLIIREISFRLKEHRCVVLDSLKKLQNMNQTFDLIILTRDPYEIVLMEEFTPLSRETISKKRLDQYSSYILWKLYNLIKPEGELFLIANHYTPKTNQTADFGFKTEQEEKNFALFSHIFKTKKKYKIKEQLLQVNVFDFQKYLSGLYVEQEVLDRLLAGRSLENMTLEEIIRLPYLDLELSHMPLLTDQEKTWSRLLPPFFEKVFLKRFVPQSLERDWEKRFSFKDCAPDYMITFLGQKKPPKTTLAQIEKDVMESRLIGCPKDLLADYRDSFDYVIRTLKVLNQLKNDNYKDLPQNFIDRLKLPLENKDRRFSAVNDIIKLMTRLGRLEKAKDFLNPDNIEGSRTKILENLEALTFFGFTHNELKEVAYIVLGHTPLGRIISGKMNEKKLKPVSDLARTFDPKQALNLLRYCRLMTVAEKEAAGGAGVTQDLLAELFDLFELTVKIVTNRELDWGTLLDEKITSMGSIHNKIVRKLLMMMNYFEFLDNWHELRQKGQMEKESIADYDDRKLSRIENVIRLVTTIEHFEEMYLKSDPLQLPAFYRKFLDIEFHGTGHFFERMDSELVFILLWITVNVSRGEVINFNPILTDMDLSEMEEQVKKVEKEVRAINTHYLDLDILRQFSDQLYENRLASIIGTGFQLRTAPESLALEIAFMDLDQDMAELESLSESLEGSSTSIIPVEDLRNLERLFSNLESFYQSYTILLERTDFSLKLPARQKGWLKRAKKLREKLKTNFANMIFHPEDIFTQIDLLYRHAPSLLNFIIPEFMALRDLDLSGHLYMTSPVTSYIVTATRKLQALIKRDRESFQNIHFLHGLAWREFGPMATGIVGASEKQIEELEGIVEHLSQNEPLFSALVTSFIFQDVGRVPFLREKYKNEINPAALGHAGALFLEKEEIAERYHLDEKGKGYLIFLVKHHSHFHHILRGELSIFSLREVLDLRDKDLFDAFFVFSFIMLSAIRDDLMLEDLAGRGFNIRAVCHKLLDGETTFEAEMEDIFARRGSLFHALETYQEKGLPAGVRPEDYLESKEWEAREKLKPIEPGKMIFAMERLFRLGGLRQVRFSDLVKLMLKIPLKFIHKKRKFSSIGYSSFEKEVYEGFRIYNTLQNLAEETRHFILNQLDGDKVRIFGYENVSFYLSYPNKIKLLLAGLLGTEKFRKNGTPIWLSFLEMSKKIEKRYEAVNDYLNTLSIEKLWGDKSQLNQLFKAKTGVVLKKESFPDVLSVDFHDRISISQKISYMSTIKNVDQLKNYFHYSLRSLRKRPFYTDDYELQLEKGFEKRLNEITDMIMDQTKKQMELIKDFEELHNFVTDLLNRSLDIGFSDEQQHRINDLYGLSKDNLKREKLAEIDGIIQNIRDIQELREYWESIKWYLQGNRRFFGKEFENLIAMKFDAVQSRVGSSP